MSFELKLGLFGACVFGIFWWIGRFPHSVLARCLMTWNGPFPLPDETRSDYFLRKARFALGWLAQITVASLILFLWTRLSPEFMRSEAFLVSMFALALGMGMALLGAALAGLASLKASLLGPNPRFVVEQLADGSQVARLGPPPEAPR